MENTGRAHKTPQKPQPSPSQGTTVAGRYEIKAYRSIIPNDIDPKDNTKITYIYVGMSEGSGDKSHMNLVV